MFCGKMRLFFLIFFPLLTGCTKFELVTLEDSTLNSTYQALDSSDYVMSNDVLERAFQMATLQWTPRNPVPMNGGGFYPRGKSVIGVPYSSVKEINTYLFQDVSYHTFMTAVHNPQSVLYSENISKSPYNGRNCAPYYGAVCSSAIMYAFDISIPYYANQIINLPYMERLEDQLIDSLKVCDVIWKSGHVQMVFDVEHRSDTLYRISMFESSDKSAHIKNYTREQFHSMWLAGRYVGYRYKRIKYSETPADFKSFEPVIYNDNLCPSKGDRAVYRTTDTVRINIFNTDYDKIVLLKDSTEIVSDEYSGNMHKFYDLLPGIYSVHLSREEEQSSEVSFEVIDAGVSYSNSIMDEKNIIVYFLSSAMPEYVALCKLWGSSTCYPISDADRERGFISIPRMNEPEYYCKVIFRGEYGRIINEPIRVF